ncbi:PAC2 family protein [Candidatus Woesearchaeota archaeon]|nr:PAC2 family protein [Candidatus Woesearchaeota archaeon]
MTWTIKKALRAMPALKNPIMIEGLPGIGNVGKVAVDFMIDELKAVKLLELRSYSMPHSVFVTEDNEVELPTIEMYYKKFGKGKKARRDLLFLAGDIQPTDEVSSYDFSYTILDLMAQLKSREIITLGGIGLPQAPENPKVYCTGNSKRLISAYKKGTAIDSNLYGVVGPIIGVTGLLIGLAKEKNIEGVCLLAETFGHPLYLGMKGSQEILKVLNAKLSLGLNLNDLTKEIKEVEQEIMKRSKQLEEATTKGRSGATSYIG